MGILARRLSHLDLVTMQRDCQVVGPPNVPYHFLACHSFAEQPPSFRTSCCVMHPRTASALIPKMRAASATVVRRSCGVRSFPIGGYATPLDECVLALTRHPRHSRCPDRPGSRRP